MWILLLFVLILGLLIPFSTSVSTICTFPPKPLGGNFKVLKLYPRKVVKYFCHPGFHLWGQDIVECDPDQGWYSISHHIKFWRFREVLNTVRAPIEAPSPIQAPGSSIRIESPPKSKIEIIEASL